MTSLTPKVLSGLTAKSSSADERWLALSEPSATCPCCGQPCSAVLSFSFDRPYVCPADIPKTNNSTVASEGDVLTADFCRLGEDRFARCVVEFPLVGLEEPLVIGVWSSLSQPNFERFAETFDRGQQAELGHMTSWLCNPVPGDAKKPEPVWMIPRDDRIRPMLEFADEQNPLYQAQRHGLEFDGLARLLKTYGHDISAQADV